MGDELTGGRPDWKEGLYFGEELPLGHPSVHVSAEAAAASGGALTQRRGLPMHGPNQFPCAATGFCDEEGGRSSSFEGYGPRLMR